LDRRPEFGLVGRSNAGKSSLINALAQSKIAKISQSPGKTTLLNFFLCRNEFFLVDMPGYGYAKRSASQRRSWEEMVEGYINNRKNLKGLILIMDIRRKWSDDEQMILEWCQQRGLPLIVVLNKIDKVGQSERTLNKRAVVKTIDTGSVFEVSCKSGRGIEPLKLHLLKGAEGNNVEVE